LRGCLSILIIAAAFIVGTVWFGGPPLAETVVEASLTGSGLTADELDVTVRADPPLRLALGRADSVEIEATGVRWNALRAGSMSMRLDGVDLLGRTATTADGLFRDVELPVAGDDPALVGITIAGSADRARTTIDVDREAVNRIALAAFEREFGTRPDSVELVAPDRIRVLLGGNALSGTLRVEPDGSLVVASFLGTARLLEPDQSLPLELTGMSIGAAGLELTGTIDLQSLLR
jgi:hypothetical protein